MPRHRDSANAAPVALGAFAPGREAAWLALAEKSLGGRPPGELETQVDGGIGVKPLYGPHNTATPAAVRVPRGPAKFRAFIAEPSPRAANRAIVEEIAGGAEEIALCLAAPGMAGVEIGDIADLERSLEAIDRDAATVHLGGLVSFARTDAPRLLDLVAGLGLDPIGWSATGALAPGDLAAALRSGADIARIALNHGHGRTVFAASGLPFHEAGASRCQELAAMAGAAVAYLRACEAAGIPPADAAQLIACEIAADADLVMTIAALRAAARIWARLGEECGFDLPAPIEARTSARMMCAEDADTNMLRNAAAALGAGIGGARALTILPHTHPIGRPDGFARRIARNTRHILAEEALIGAVADAGAGSYAIETLTDDLCRGAWALFAAVEARGGIAAALTSGFISAQIAETRAARDRDIAEGRLVLVGATQYTDGRPPRPDAEPWTVPPVIGEAEDLLRPMRLEEAATS